MVIKVISNIDDYCNKYGKLFIFFKFLGSLFISCENIDLQYFGYSNNSSSESGKLSSVLLNEDDIPSILNYSTIYPMIYQIYNPFFRLK